MDNAPPPEPHDVRAHLHGGVPFDRHNTSLIVKPNVWVDMSVLGLLYFPSSPGTCGRGRAVAAAVAGSVEGREPSSPPVPAATVLERVTEAGSEASLTLVSAPAGFGKTTVLAAWLARASTGKRSSFSSAMIASKSLSNPVYNPILLANRPAPWHCHTDRC